MNSPALQIVWFLIAIFALYLSFKRNNGFNLGSFLVALLFPPIYIVYFYATEGNYMKPIVI